MRQAQHQLSIATNGKGLVEITPPVKRWVAEQGIATGLLTLYCRHTSASLLIQENADPDVQTDLKNFFEDVAPENREYVHDTEGPDDMPAHIRTALTHTSLAIPIPDHLRRGQTRARGPGRGFISSSIAGLPHRREIVLHLIGE